MQDKDSDDSEEDDDEQEEDDDDDEEEEDDDDADKWFPLLQLFTCISFPGLGNTLCKVVYKDCWYHVLGRVTHTITFLWVDSSTM